MRASDGQHTRVHLAHQIAAALARFGAEAAGDNHLAVFCQRLADGVQAFPDGIVDEATGIDNHQVGAFKGLGSLIALRAQLRKNQFGIGQCFWAAQTDKAHAWRRFGRQSRGLWGSQKNFTHYLYFLKAG